MESIYAQASKIIFSARFLKPIFPTPVPEKGPSQWKWARHISSKQIIIKFYILHHFFTNSGPYPFTHSALSFQSLFWTMVQKSVWFDCFSDLFFIFYIANIRYWNTYHFCYKQWQLRHYYLMVSSFLFLLFHELVRTDSFCDWF